jgi:hypothetical protein
VNQNKGIKFVAILLGVIAGVFILLAAAIIAPPPYTARINYNIDWSRLPGSLTRHKSEDEIAKIRRELDRQFCNPATKDFREYVYENHFCNSATAPEPMKRAVLTLKIDRAGTKDSVDYFQIQVRGSNPEIASNICWDAVNFETDHLYKAIRKEINVFDYFRRNDDLSNKRFELQNQIEELEQQQMSDPDRDRAAEIRELKGELNNLGEGDPSFQDFGILPALLFDIPGNWDSAATIHKRGHALGILALCAAVFAGRLTYRLTHGALGGRPPVKPVPPILDEKKPPVL